MPMILFWVESYIMTKQVRCDSKGNLLKISGSVEIIIKAESFHFQLATKKISYFSPPFSFRHFSVFHAASIPEMFSNVWLQKKSYWVMLNWWYLLAV